MFAHYERISQIIDGENQTNQINGAVCPVNKGQKTLRGRCVPKRIVARRSNVDIRHALHLRKQLGNDALLFGDVVRIAERHLDTVIEFAEMASTEGVEISLTWPRNSLEKPRT
mgnify:CR=1 FL=1